MTLLDVNNVTQTVTLSLDEAVALGLVTLDVNNIPFVNNAMLGQTVIIQPPEPVEESVKKTVGVLIASFFGLDPAVVDSLNKEGSIRFNRSGMLVALRTPGGCLMCSDILEAKKSGDYSAFVLPDGTAATN